MLPPANERAQRSRTTIFEMADRIQRTKAAIKDGKVSKWIGVTAIAHGATLVHKDPEFAPLGEIVQEVLK